MSEENVEFARRWVRLSNAGDFDAVYNEILDPDIEFFTNEEQPHVAPGKGRDDYIKAAKDERDSFDKHQLEVVEWMGLGEYVIGVARIHARGKVSGAEVTGNEVWLTRWRDGKCVEYRECATKKRALEVAAKLRGHGTSF